MEKTIPWALHACWHLLDLLRFKMGGMLVTEDIRVTLCPFGTAHTMPLAARLQVVGGSFLGAQLAEQLSLVLQGVGTCASLP